MYQSPEDNTYSVPPQQLLPSKPKSELQPTPQNPPSGRDRYGHLGKLANLAVAVTKAFNVSDFRNPSWH